MVSNFLQVNIVDGAFFPLFSPEPCHIILKRRSMCGVLAKLAIQGHGIFATPHRDTAEKSKHTIKLLNQFIIGTTTMTTLLQV